jgi:hypothetical protein
MRQTFDDVTRTMATGADRRKVLKGLAGVALGSTGLFAASQATSAEDDTFVVAGRRCRRRCLRRCRRRNGDDCRERCCRDDDGGDDNGGDD